MHEYQGAWARSPTWAIFAGVTDAADCRFGTSTVDNVSVCAARVAKSRDHSAHRVVGREVLVFELLVRGGGGPRTGREPFLDAGALVRHAVGRDDGVGHEFVRDGADVLGCPPTHSAAI